MRRRHHDGQTRHDSMQQESDRDLQEALLPAEEEEPKVHGRPHGQQLIVYTGPFDLQGFIFSVILKCASALTSCWKVVETSCMLCLNTLALRHNSRPQQLSLLQEERLEQLWVSLSQAYDPEDQDHQQSLRDLWAHAFPGEPCTALKSEQWKDMGWQGDDPSTDVRGAGLYGVHNLLYLARQHPAEFDRLLHKRSGQRSDWEYPFAAAGMNLTFALAELLGLKRGPTATTGDSAGPPLERMQKQPAFVGFVALLSSEPYSFEELYVVSFRLLDDRWLRSKASYMQFNAVMKECVADLTQALKSKPASFQHLNSLLGL